MRNKPPLISVIIANFNGGKFLPKCLSSILQEEGNYEVIVVDDGSTDGSIQYLKTQESKFKNTTKKSRLKIIFNRNNLGAAAARNIGVKASLGKYLFFLDNDTKIKKGWFDEVIHFFSTHKKTGIAQAKLLKMGTDRFDYAGDYLGPFGFLIERARSARDKGQFDKEEQIFALKSAAMIAKRNVFEKIGGFDPDYKIFWEDTDIAWRAWLAGYRVLFTPKIVVWHAYGTDQKSSKPYVSNKVYYRGCRNNIVTLLKNLGIKKLFLTLPINVACWFLLAFVFLLRADFKKSLAIARGIWWNFVNFPSTLKKRRKIQKERKVSDDKLFAAVGAKRNILYYFGKGIAYVRGQPF